MPALFVITVSSTLPTHSTGEETKVDVVTIVDWPEPLAEVNTISPDLGSVALLKAVSTAFPISWGVSPVLIGMGIKVVPAGGVGGVLIPSRLKKAMNLAKGELIVKYVVPKSAAITPAKSNVKVSSDAVPK
jgi:hypothetical protein